MDDDTRVPPRRVTITDIARHLSVSPTTVSNAFNRPDQLSQALRERVLEAARELGFRGLDSAARSMRRGRMSTAGVLYADRLASAFHDQAFVHFLRGLAEVAEDASLALTLIPGSPAAMRDPAGVEQVMVDGFVVYSMADDDPLARAAVDRRLPLVVADAPSLDGVPRVGIDDETAARLAAEHLVRLGHRRFGIVSGELGSDRRSGPVDPGRQDAATFGVNRERLKGFESALTRAGIPRESVAVEEIGDAIERDAYVATERLLDHEPRPTALLVMSDRMALVVLQAIADRGLRVPDDVSVVGFDDIPAAATATPPLTTIRQPHVEKGRVAGKLLIARLRGEVATSPVILPTELVVRESTGRAPARDAGTDP